MELDLSFVDSGGQVVKVSRYGGFTKAASDCLYRTMLFAAQFGHRTACAAHLILALAGAPNAGRQFKFHHLDLEAVARNAIDAMKEISRVGLTDGEGTKLYASDELSSILQLAADIAKHRDMQEMSVDDLLCAIAMRPETSETGLLVRGSRQVVPAIDIRDALNDFLGQVNARVAEAFEPCRQAIDVVVSEVIELKQLVNNRDLEISDLRRQLRMVLDRLIQQTQTPSLVPEPTQEQPEPHRVWDWFRAKPAGDATSTETSSSGRPTPYQFDRATQPSGTSAFP